MKAYAFGLLPLKAPRVKLRPIANLSMDLRDHHLISRWARLCLRWRRS